MLCRFRSHHLVRVCGFIGPTCAGHMPGLEIGYDRSPATGRVFVGVGDANHGFLPCRPEYGEFFKRGFDYAGSWLPRPGRPQ